MPRYALDGETRAVIILSGVKGLGATNRVKLIGDFGSAEAVLKASDRELKNRRLSSKVIAQILDASPDDPLDPEDEELLQKPDIGFVHCSDPDYPPLLRHIYAPPAMLYVRGSLEGADERCAALVGSRKALPPALRTARSIARGLAETDAVVVSGLARGVDAAAHIGALEGGGRTFAVLPHGLGLRAYPAENRDLAERIARSGALISELPIRYPVRRTNFDPRNRIISGICWATVVAQAHARSGALITARHAADAGRPVFAVPWERAPYAAGSNSLLDDGAEPVESYHDILDLAGDPPRRRAARPAARQAPQRPPQRAAATPPPPSLDSTPQPAERPVNPLPQPRDPGQIHFGNRTPPSAERADGNRADERAAETGLEGAEAALWAELSDEPTLIDTLIQKTGLPAHEASAALLMLEMKDLAQQHPGMRYTRLQPQAAQQVRSRPAVYQTRHESGNMIQNAVQKLIERESLSEAEAALLMNEIMDGAATDAQIGAFLAAARMKGETAKEITGFAKTMRGKAIQIRPAREPLIDTCGTGGDGAHTFNISTAAAFIAAGAGAAVAKHGNRSVSSKCGSSNVLEELGVNIHAAPEQIERCIDETGVGFLFAPTFHKAMKNVAKPRQELGIRTVFNILGPLTNPAGATRQLLGVFDPKWLRPMAETLRNLGSERALVVHGRGGLDEISLAGRTQVAELKDGSVETYEIDPRECGVTPAGIDRLKGGDPPENARILRGVLNGEEGPKREVAVLNAAAALLAAGIAEDLPDGIERAREAIDAGAAKNALDELIRVSNLDSGAAQP